MTLLLLWLGLPAWGLPVKAQVFQDQDFRQAAEAGLDYTYNLEFEKAHRHFETLKVHYPEHPAPHYLLAFNRWWQSYISTTNAYHDFIGESLAKALALNEGYTDQEGYDLEYTFFQYMIYAFQSRLHILRREWWSGANTGLKALPYLEKGIAYSDRSPEFYFSSGIYHYYAETYPEKHSYIKPFMVFFPEGNASKGLEELIKAGTLENFTQVESLYYLGDIYLEEEADYRKALQVKRKLMRKYPQNTWFEADYARALVYDGQYEQAQEILGSMQVVFEAITRSQSRQVSSQESRYTTLLMVRIYHYLGRCAFEEDQEYAQAQLHFQSSLKMATLAGLTEYEYIPNNHFWLAKIHAQQGDKTAAITALEKVLDSEENEQVLDRAISLLEELE